MCGICGIVNFTQVGPSVERIARMVASIRHRGPDNAGTFVEGPVGLGHARLSILDLSANGHQPMRAATAPVVIAYNGEIYNFPALRRELEAAGVTFRGHSDTEVILEGFVRWGEAILPRLEGMFALAIWDSRNRSLLLARDRFGIKPLYVAAHPGGLTFASEIKAIRADGAASARVSAQALSEFLWFGNALGRESLFADVRRIMPGHQLVIRDGHTDERAFWTLADVKPVVATPEVAAAEVARRLEAAVASHLVSDVPVGVFLSGGIDSSAITAYASRHYGGKLRTYAVGFDFAAGVDELPKARRVAERFNTEHEEIRIAGTDLPDVIRRLSVAHDEPFGDAADIPLFLLAERVRSVTKVVLQGDGGDEMFGGYRRYQMLAMETLWRAAARATPLTRHVAKLRRLHRFLLALRPDDPAERMALLLTIETRERPPCGLLSDAWRQAVSRTDPFAHYRSVARSLGDLDAVQRMIFTDVSILLPDTFLEKVDKATMAHGLEVRVPFLDAALADYALGLPAAYKASRREKKWILRRALRGVVPDDILDGPKTGFNVPFEYWLRTSLAGFLREVVLDHSVAHLFQRQALERAIADHVNGTRDNGFLLWKMLQLGLWAQRNPGAAV